jgi:TonB family protein
VKLLIHIFILFSCLKFIAQANPDSFDSEFEENAEFPGGISEMAKFVQNNLKYPEVARELLLGGKVFLKFIVNEGGNIDSIDVLKGSGCKEMNEEAIRVVKLMPKWKPASMTGKNVKCYFNLPISYSLDEPFYTFNVTSKNESYKKITQLIFDGKSDEAYAIIDNLNVDSKDSDLLYNKAVLLFNLKKRREACDCFSSIIETADVKSSVYNNSNKYYKKYCN